MVELSDGVRQFLAEPRIAVFGSTNRDGTPHLTGLWFELRGDEIILNTGTASKKVRNVRREPRASVCVQEHNPARHVTLEGTVTLDDSRVMEDLTSLATRYAGPDAGPGIAQNISKVPHITLRLRIEKVKTFGKI